jgi:ketosteroid isomerase-like protein
MLRIHWRKQVEETMQTVPMRLRPARGFACFLAAVLILALSSGAWAQKKKKSDDGDNSTPVALLPVPDSDTIEQDIGEMLAAFQVGDVEGLHKYYSDNVVFVSAAFAPPVIGWKNYEPQYEAQKAAFQGMQIIRRNTLIIVHQDVSWVTYEWQFATMLNGKPYSAQGQTTLILNKVNDKWLIVHNHTSQIYPDEQQAAQSQQAPAQYSQQPAAAR